MIIIRALRHVVAEVAYLAEDTCAFAASMWGGIGEMVKPTPKYHGRTPVPWDDPSHDVLGDIRQWQQEWLSGPVTPSDPPGGVGVPGE